MYLYKLRDILELIIDDPEASIDMINNPDFWRGRCVFGGSGVKITRNDMIKVLKELGKRKIRPEEAMKEVDEMKREGYRSVMFRGDRWRYYY